MASTHVSADFDATYDGINIMKTGVENCTATVESACQQVAQLGMTGAAADAFRQVVDAWYQQMTGEINRLGEFATMSLQVVQAMEEKEAGRARQVDAIAQPERLGIPVGIPAPLMPTLSATLPSA
ncbi:hypothetical protein [Streptomyces sp. NPDC005125]